MRSNRDGSQAAIWRAIRSAGRHRWTMPDMADDAGVSIHTVRHYVRALARAGIVIVVEPSAPTQAGATPACYRSVGHLGELPAIVRGAGAALIAYDPNRSSLIGGR